MSEAYMTYTEVSGLSSVMHLLNDKFKPYNWTTHFNLSMNIMNEDGSVMGEVVWVEDEDSYTFVPGTGYMPYEATDRGE